MNPTIEKLLKLPLYQRVLMLAGIVGVIAAGFIYLIYLPQSQELSGLKDRRERLEAKLEEDQRIADNLPKFREEFEKMKKRLDLALAELPNEKEIPTLLTNIAGLAKDNGLDVLRFKPGSEVPQGFYAEVPVELKLVGSYHEVAMFFNDIGNMSRIVNINNLQMGGAKADGGRNLLSVECLATTFRFVDNPQEQQGNKKGTNQ
ncbi:MAG: type 4a pilus biogenesis protein PilO [Syntrophotaleaceae bacterium]